MTGQAKPAGLDSAVAHAHDPVGSLADLQRVRDQDHGLAAILVQLSQEVHDLVRCL
jgi:hypothetical protein